MIYDKSIIAGKLRDWQRYFASFTLPKWDELPEIELYMDQVVALLEKYLDFFPHEEGERIITPVAINNYVRMRIMPAPVKKKYSRRHLAYLIMICTLKQSLSIAYISKMIPVRLEEDEVKKMYDEYVETHKAAELYFIDQVGKRGGALFNGEETGENVVFDLLTQLTAFSAFAKNLAEKVIELPDEGEKQYDEE